MADLFGLNEEDEEEEDEELPVSHKPTQPAHMMGAFSSKSIMSKHDSLAGAPTDRYC